MGYRNRQLLLTRYAAGLPDAENFTFTESTLDTCAPDHIIVRNHFLSADPAQKGWMSGVANYASAQLQQPMKALAVGQVVESRLDGFNTGDYVCGWLGWQEYAHVDQPQIIRTVDPTVAPIQTALGVMGINGLTAYIALEDILAPQAGETLLVSSAAGAVGSIVGQLARAKGCRVVGLTGSDIKVELACSHFGYHQAINYKTAELANALNTACPKGIDAYFDNVGGQIADAVFSQMNNRGRIAQVGTASIASWDPVPSGPRRERLILIKELFHRGFVIFNHAHRFDDALLHLSDLIREGKLNYKEEIYNGLEQAPQALASLYNGDNLGKTLIQLVDS